MKHSSHGRQAFAAVVLLFAVLALIGCSQGGPKGGPRGPVEGTVTLNGTPVDGGRIKFLPENETGAKHGGVETYAVIINGKYALDKTNGPSPGKYKIEIIWPKRTGKKVKNSEGREIMETQELVPATYNVQSKIFVDINLEKNTHSLALKG